MRISIALFFCACTFTVFSQEVSPFTKFGKISPANFEKKVYAIDSNAHAVVLSDIGQTSIEGNSKGSFSINFTRHRVVHILNKNGYDVSNVEIPLYSNGSEVEKLENIRGVTYNMENGHITETKLDKGGIFAEKVSKNLNRKKFTMPNVKEGSIIEYEYTVISDYITNLDPWLFQEDIPILWSECKLSVPQFYTYAFLSHGYHPMHINDRKDRIANFILSDNTTAGATDRSSFTSGVTDWRWVMVDVPPIKQESFTSALKNHLANIEFQLASVSYPYTPQDFRSTWNGLIKELNESEYFGAHLNKDNNWMSDDMKSVLAGTTAPMDKAKKIYSYVRDNFNCIDYSALHMSQTLKNVFKSRKGNVSDINLLLTAMLKYAGLEAYPVILSTTDHGYALENYPMITSFNYVVAQLKENGKEYFLDASHTGLGFGWMLPECYNGHARLVDDMASPISLSADSLKEKKLTVVFMTNDKDGKLVGSIHHNPGYYESYSDRQKIKEKGTEAFFKDKQKDLGADIQIKNPGIDSLDQLDIPIRVHYDFEMNPHQADLLYVNPLFSESWKKNPFKAAQRYYPVEMPYTSDETYLLTMEVPESYEVDELPKQVVVKLDDQESAYFEYRITYSASTISMRCRLKISKILFLPEQYESLREFFNMVVTKQNEQIVFKKKK